MTKEIVAHSSVPGSAKFVLLIPVLPKANRSIPICSRLRKHQDEFNTGVVTANFEAAAKLRCECVYQAHSQSFS